MHSLKMTRWGKVTVVVEDSTIAVELPCTSDDADGSVRILSTEASFLPRDAMVARYMSVCLSQFRVLLKRLNVR